MKVRLIRLCACEPFNRAENVGDEFTVNSKLGKEMIDAGVAEEIKTEKKSKPV